MPCEIGDIAAGEGGVGRVVGIDGPLVRIKLFPPDDQPDIESAVITIGPEVKVIRKHSPGDELVAAFVKMKEAPVRAPKR